MPRFSHLGANLKKVDSTLEFFQDDRPGELSAGCV